MSIDIKYGGVNFFKNNNLPTPKIKRSLSNKVIGDKRGAVELLTIEGQIYIDTPPVNCNYLEAIENIRDDLIIFFQDDYKKLEVFENSHKILDKDFCEISSISFPESNYVKFINYAIEIICYDEITHRELFNVRNAVDKISIEKKSNGDVFITRLISAEGLNTQDGNLSGNNVSNYSNSFDNAFNFVSSKQSIGITNLSSVGLGSMAFHLMSKQELINRIKGFYSITESYLAPGDTTSVTDGILNFSIDKSSTFNSFSKYSVSGDIIAGNFNSVTMQNLRDRFESIDFKQEIVDAFGPNDLFELPDSLSITENASAKSIVFNIDYSNNDKLNGCGIYKNISYNIVNDENIIRVSVDGIIAAKGPGRKRVGLVEDYFYNVGPTTTSFTSWIHESAQNELNKFYSGVLHGDPEEKSVSINKDTGEIKFSYVYSNIVKPNLFIDYECNVSMEVGIPKYKIDMNFGGTKDKYLVSRNGFQVDRVTITASGEYKNNTDRDSDRNNAINQLKTQVNTKFTEVQNNYLSGKSFFVISKNNNYNKSNNITEYSEERNYYDKIIK